MTDIFTQPYVETPPVAHSTRSSIDLHQLIVQELGLIKQHLADLSQATPVGQSTKKIIVAITGASGAADGVRLQELLATLTNIERHLIVSQSAVLTLEQELGIAKHEVEALACHVHSVKDIGATLASGSFQSDGMVIADRKSVV